MGIITTTTEPLTKEEKDGRGRLWATDDDGTTYWMESLNDILLWMKEHDPDAFIAVMERRLRSVSGPH
jgi:hypothetical protein